ncbi:MAG: ETC complex I subunit [Caulobacteraceae bacterium]
MLARIYLPAKNAMQSGRANSKEWVLEFAPASARLPDPLMGWTVSTDMNGQVRLAFETREEAVAYAQRHGIAFEVLSTPARRKIVKAYADNFAFTRREPWTH